MLLVDKQPLGVGGELRAALLRLREHGGRAVLGLRDILDEPEAVRAEWTPETTRLVLEHYPRVLVYGNESVFDTMRLSALPSALAAARALLRLRDARPCPARRGGTVIRGSADGRTRPLVLGTTGGGEDGLRVLEAFVDASEGEQWDAVAVTGPQLSRRRDDVARASARTRRAWP